MSVLKEIQHIKGFLLTPPPVEAWRGEKGMLGHAGACWEELCSSDHQKQDSREGKMLLEKAIGASLACYTRVYFQSRSVKRMIRNAARFLFQRYWRQVPLHLSSLEPWKEQRIVWKEAGIPKVSQEQRGLLSFGKETEGTGIVCRKNQDCTQRYLSYVLFITDIISGGKEKGLPYGDKQQNIQAILNCR